MHPIPFPTYPKICFHFFVLYIEFSKISRALTSNTTILVPKQSDKMPVVNATNKQISQHIKEIKLKTVKEINPRVEPWSHNYYLQKHCFNKHKQLTAVRTLLSGVQGHAKVIHRKYNKELMVQKFVLYHKVLYYQGEDEISDKIKILRDFFPDHSNVVKLLDYSVVPGHVNLFSPFYHGRDLFNLVNKYSIAELKVLKLMEHILGCDQTVSIVARLPYYRAPIQPANQDRPYSRT